MPDRRDDFFVGYAAKAPSALGRWLRRLSIGLLCGAAAVAAAVVALQGRFAESSFEYGTVRTFEGSLRSAPYPALTLTAPGDRAGETLLLVEFGKKGADDRVAGLEGRSVRLSGQLIYRDDTRMAELTSDPLEDLGPSDRPPAEDVSLGESRLVGEIVDSKCHLGVMKPGEGKPHRGCAVRCISGGSPPMLWVRDSGGRSRQFLLVGRDDRQLNREVLELVAEAVGVQGEVVRRGDLWLLRTEPEEIRRLAPGDG